MTVLHYVQDDESPESLTNAMQEKLGQIRQLRRRLARYLVETPVIECPELEGAAGTAIGVHAKLEFLQRTGTFKARGALSAVLDLEEAEIEAGVTAVSAGNHAVAVAFAAKAVGTSAKVVMTASANPERVARARAYGAEIVFADDVHSAFDTVEGITRQEGRFLVHPFEGEKIALGTGTLGLEMVEQLPEAEVLIVPIGGGGLCAGISLAAKAVNPNCQIIGVEPEGADSMFRSIEAGSPQVLDEVRTIADSLGAPFAMPVSFELCRQHVDQFLRVSDEEIRGAMRLLFRRMKMAVEPACAATTAALIGPARKRVAGRRVAILMCGSNIDWQSYYSLSELGCRP